MRHILRLWCRTFGHRWVQWVEPPWPGTPLADMYDRCTRCLDWRWGTSPMQCIADIEEHGDDYIAAAEEVAERMGRAVGEALLTDAIRQAQERTTDP